MALLLHLVVVGNRLIILSHFHSPFVTSTCRERRPHAISRGPIRLTEQWMLEDRPPEPLLAGQVVKFLIYCLLWNDDKAGK